MTPPPDPYSLLVVDIEVIPLQKEACGTSGLTFDSDSEADEWSRLESVLGIYPGKVAQSSHISRNGSGGIEDERIIIRGFIPGSPAIFSQHMQMGDIIEEVNGVPVNLKSVETILGSIAEPTKLSLTIRKGSPIKSASIHEKLCGGNSESSLIPYFNSDKFVKSDNFKFDEQGTLYKVSASGIGGLNRFKHPQIQGLEAVRVVPLLSTDSKQYCYPNSFMEDFEQLDEACKAISMTLSDLVFNSFNSDTPKSLTTTIHNMEVSVSYAKLSNHLVLFICESSVMNLRALQNLAKFYSSLLRFMLPDLTQLSRSSSSDEKDALHSTLDYLFSSSFKNVKRAVKEEMVFMHFTSPKTLKLNLEVHNLLAEYVTEFESSAWRLEAGCLIGQRKPFLINGTLVYYKDYVIRNSFSGQWFQPIHMLLSALDVLATDIPRQGSSPKDSQLVLWREVFLDAPESLEFEVYSGRTFLLVIRLKLFTLCAVLESGACAQRYQSAHEDPIIKCPGIYYREGLNLLYNLRRVDLESDLLNTLQSECDPALSCADEFLAPAFDPHVETEKKSTLRRIQEVFNRDKRGVMPKKRVALRQASPSKVRAKRQQQVTSANRRVASPSPARTIDGISRNSSLTRATNASRSRTIIDARSQSLTRRGKSAPPNMKRMTEVAISEGQLDEWNGEAKAGHQSLSMTKSYGKSSYNESAGVVSTPVGEPKSSLGSTHSIAETSSAHASSVPMQASLKSASSMPSSGSMYSVDSRNMFYEGPSNVSHSDITALTLPTKAVAGVENSLFYFLDLRASPSSNFSSANAKDEVSTAVCPSISQISKLGGPLHAQIVLNFNKAIARIKTQFDKQSCYEMAYLFTCRPSTVSSGATSSQTAASDDGGRKDNSAKSDGKQAEVIRYWVVGRNFPEQQRQVFICHHDNCWQNMTEAAFKILLATSW